MQLRIREGAGGRPSNGGEFAPSLLTALLCLSLSCSPKGQAGLDASPSPHDAPASAPSGQVSNESASASAPTPSPTRTLFKTGEAVPAGYMGYKVYSSWFTDRLSGPEPSKPSPAASYLYIDLSVVNTDTKERVIGPFKLADENGKEYSPSERAWKMEKSLGQIGMLAPSVGKRGFLVFEVPKNHPYKLKLKGFSDADEISIELSPTAAPPSP